MIVDKVHVLGPWLLLLLNYNQSNLGRECEFGGVDWSPDWTTGLLEQWTALHSQHPKHCDSYSSAACFSS